MPRPAGLAAAAILLLCASALTPTLSKAAEGDVPGAAEGDEPLPGERGLLPEDTFDDWPAVTPIVAPMWLTPIGELDVATTPGSGLEVGLAFSGGVGVPGVGYFATNWGGVKYGLHRFGLESGAEDRAKVHALSLFSGDSTNPLWEDRLATLSFFSEAEVGIYRMGLSDGAAAGLSAAALDALPPTDEWQLGGGYRLGARVNLPTNAALSYSAGIQGIQEEMRWGHWLGSRALLGLGRLGLAIPFGIAGKGDSLLHTALGAAMNLGWVWLNYTQKYNWPWDDPAPRWYVSQMITFSFSFPEAVPATDKSEGYE